MEYYKFPNVIFKAEDCNAPLWDLIIQVLRKYDYYVEYLDGHYMTIYKKFNNDDELPFND